MSDLSVLKPRLQNLRNSATGRRRRLTYPCRAEAVMGKVEGFSCFCRKKITPASVPKHRHSTVASDTQAVLENQSGDIRILCLRTSYFHIIMYETFTFKYSLLSVVCRGKLNRCHMGYRFGIALCWRCSSQSAVYG